MVVIGWGSIFLMEIRSRLIVFDAIPHRKLLEYRVCFRVILTAMQSLSGSKHINTDRKIRFSHKRADENRYFKVRFHSRRTPLELSSNHSKVYSLCQAEQDLMQGQARLLAAFREQFTERVLLHLFFPVG
jgi:hypothetical protein